MSRRFSFTTFTCLVFFSLGLGAPAAPEPQEGLSEPVTLRGRVVGPDGSPVFGATIRILPKSPEGVDRSALSDAPEPVVVQTDQDGRFATGYLAGPSFWVRVEADGFAPFSREVLSGASLNGRLAKGHSLLGAVFDLASGEPVVGASITACDAGATPFGSDACSETESGEDGEFFVVDLPRGAVEVEVLADGHAVERLADFAIPVSSAPDQASRRIEIFLRAGVSIGGRVLDPEDRPIEGATVTLHVQDLQKNRDLTRRENPSERTDAAGRFDFQGVPVDARYMLDFSADGYVSTALGPSSVERKMLDLLVRLGKGATLEARLVDADNVGVDALEIELDSGHDPARGGNRSLLSGRWVSQDHIEPHGDGRFTVTRLPPGTYTVRLLPEHHAEVERKGVGLREGGEVDLGTIVVRKGETIAGTVTDDRREPIENAEVRVTWQQEDRFAIRVVRTNAEGRYRVSGLGEAPAQLSARAEGHGTEHLSDISPSQKDIDFVLQRTGSVVGRVTLYDGLAPVVFQIRAYLEAGDEPEKDSFGPFRTLARDDANVFSDPGGSYRIDGLEPGIYTLEALTKGLAPGKTIGIRVLSAGVTEARPIVLEKGMRITGRVLKAGDDTPIPGAAVRISVPSATGFRSETPNLGEMTVAGRDGRFSLEGVHAGSHSLTVEHPEYAPADTRVSVAEENADAPEIVIRLSRGGTIAGTVRDADGELVPDAGIRLVRRGGGAARTAATDVDGHYVFMHVAPDTYNLSRTASGYWNMGTKTATAGEGQTVVVDFDDAPAIHLSGFLRRGDERIAEATLFFVRDAGDGTGLEMKSTRSAPDGAYEITLSSGGPYRVTVRTPSARSSVELSVPDEPEAVLDIVVPATGIAGTVTDTDRNAISGAMVMVNPVVSGADTPTGTGAATDSSGAYVVEGIEPGKYRVSISASGFSSAEQLVDVSSLGVTAGVDFRLESGRVLRGRVVDPSGRGLTGAVVVVMKASTGEIYGQPTFADVNGGFAATAAPDGAVDIAALAPGWAPACRTGIVPREGEEIVVTLSLGGMIEVRVQAPDGRPRLGVQVSIEPLAEIVARRRMLRQPLPTDPHGVSLADSLPPGSYNVSVPARPDVVARQVTVTEGETTSVVLVLAPP